MIATRIFMAVWLAVGLVFVAWRLRWKSMRREHWDALLKILGLFLAVALGPVAALVYYLDGARFRRRDRARRSRRD